MQLDDIQRLYLVTDNIGPVFMSTDIQESIKAAGTATKLGFVGVRLRSVKYSVTAIRELLETRQDLCLFTDYPA